MAALAEGRAVAAAAAAAVAAAVAAAAVGAAAGAAAAAAAGAAAAAAAAVAAPVDGGDGDATKQTLITQKMPCWIGPHSRDSAGRGTASKQSKSLLCWRAGVFEPAWQDTPRPHSSPGAQSQPSGRGRMLWVLPFFALAQNALSSSILVPFLQREEGTEQMLVPRLCCSTRPR